MEVRLLDNKLAITILSIVKNKFYDPTRDETWEHIHPMIIDHIENLFDDKAMHEDNLKNGDSNVESEINNFANLIKKQCKLYFQKDPPFTILRICELLSQPEKEGYKFNNTKDLIKYMAALWKLFNVTLSVNRFPRPTFEAQSQTKVDNDAIKMIRIPWLEETRNNSSSSSQSPEDSPEVESIQIPKTNDTVSVSESTIEKQELASK